MAPDRTDITMSALVLVWGTAFVSIKVLGAVLDPFQLALFRYIPFILISGVWLLGWQRHKFAKISGADWIRFGAAGMLGVVGYHIPLNFSTSNVTPGEPITGGMAAVLVATTPLWTMLWVSGAGIEKISRRRAIGAFLAFAGVAMVVFLGRPDVDGPQAVAKGLVAILAPLFWSFYSIIAKPLIQRHGGLFTTAVTMTLGTFALLPAGLHDGIGVLHEFGLRQWWWMAYLSLLATVGGYIVWNQALSKRSAAQVTAFIFAIPVVATLAGALLIQEPITVWFVMGSALVIYGLTQVQRKEQPA